MSIIYLDEIIDEDIKLSTGTTVNEGEGVSITPPSAGEDIVLAINSGDAGITVSEEDVTGDALVTIGDGESIKRVVDIINAGDAENNNQIATVNAITQWVTTQVSGLDIPNFATVAEFDTYLTSSDTISGGFAVVNSTVEFDYTDSAGRTELDQVRMVCYVVKASGETAQTAIFISSNDNTELTGASISSLIYALSDHNQLTDARATIVDNIQQSLTDGITQKVDKVAGKALSSNDLTNAYKAILDNSPDDINESLSLLMPILSVGVNAIIDNAGNGNGSLTFRNSAAPTNQRDFMLIARSDGTFDFESLDDAGDLQERWTFDHNGITSFPDQITQSGNNVLDVSDSKYTNLPENTQQEITDLDNAKVNIDGLKVLSDNNFTDTLKNKLDGLGDSDFDGGTVANAITVTSSSQTIPTFVSKRLSNANSIYLTAAQNSGGNYISAWRQDESDGGRIKLSVGSDADITGLTDVLEIGSSLVNINRTTHISGDMFCFDGGNIAGNDITAVGKFVGSDFRIDGSASHDYNVIYTATQGNTNSPEGNKAADGKTGSGEHLRIRLPNQTDRAYIVENSIGLNLQEINSSTGIMKTANQIETGGDVITPKNSRFGRVIASHGSSNNGNMKYGSIIGSSFSGMQIDTTDNGTYNKEELNFYTHGGGVSAGRRFHIGEDGRSFFQQKLLVGSNSYPSETLQVVGTFKVSGLSTFQNSIDVATNVEIGNKLVLSDNSNREFKLEPRSNGLVWSAKSNPASGDNLFGVEDANGNLALGVERNGRLTSTNSNIWLGTDSGGTTGGYRVNRVKAPYYNDFTSLTKTQIVEDWLGQPVKFNGAGANSYDMPEIVSSNPSTSQFQVGDWFWLFNGNTGADITLIQFSGQNKWFRDNVGDIVTGDIVLGFNESFMILVVQDYRLGGDGFGFDVRRISSSGGS